MPNPKKLVEYVTTVDRYVDGTYYKASPEFPATILLPEGTRERRHLKLKREEPPAKIMPPFAPGVKGPAPAAHSRDLAGKRPSDNEP